VAGIIVHRLLNNSTDEARWGAALTTALTPAIIKLMRQL
jgi:hypothetical protein